MLGQCKVQRKPVPLLHGNWSADHEEVLENRKPSSGQEKDDIICSVMRQDLRGDLKRTEISKFSGFGLLPNAVSVSQQSHPSSYN